MPLTDDEAKCWNEAVNAATRAVPGENLPLGADVVLAIDAERERKVDSVAIPCLVIGATAGGFFGSLLTCLYVYWS